MRTRARPTRTVPLLLLVYGAIGCGEPARSDETDASVAETASTTIKLRQAPSAVRCIRVLVTSGATLTRDFAVTGGQATSSLDLGRLRPGPTTFDAEAYNVACSAVTSTTVPEWIGEPVFRVLDAGQNPPISLTLVPHVPTTATVDFSTPPRQVVAASAHSYAVQSNGTVRAWGRRSQGALGDNSVDETLRNTPVSSTALSGVALLRASKHQATQCSITSAGALRCWGSNGFGELGDGTTTQRNAPVVSGLTNVADVAIGQGFTCAVERPDAATGEAHVSCVGQGSSCQLGNPAMSSSTAFVQISGIANARSVVAGSDFACALTSDNYVRCWGANWNGQTGHPTSSYQVCSPTFLLGDVVQIAAGHQHVCALRGDGSVWCWGRVDGVTQVTPVRVPALGDVVEITASWFATCARSANGEVRCWGVGPLGTGGGTSPTPVTVRGIEDATSISGGSRHVCATTASSGLLCWGANEAGQIGDGTFDGRPTPALVSW